MESNHNLTDEDWQDMELAQQYRLSLSSSPSQSSFRVLALLFFELLEEEESTSAKSLPILMIPMMNETNPKGNGGGSRKYIVGTNDEPGYMGGAICAERAAMVQLRFAPPHKLTKVVISTDSEDPISPGLLCREFLAGHAKQVPWDLRVISEGCICARCGRRDNELLECFSKKCSDDHEHHAVKLLETTIAELYPFPSPYTRLTAKESTELGEVYSGMDRAMNDLLELDASVKRVLEVALLEARSKVDDGQGDLHPIHFGAAVVFEDGTIASARQSNALEFGCTLDAVSQLATHIQESSSPPLLIVQADQYGIAHAPFAPARAFLTERGYGDCHVLIHDTAPADQLHVNVVDQSTIQGWVLRTVAASELAPNPPSWASSDETDQSSTANKLLC